MNRNISLLGALLTLGLTTIACGEDAAATDRGGDRGRYQWVEVSGTGTHYFAPEDVIVHSQRPTPTGYVQRSTDTIDLEGDLRGRVLYHPVSVFDFEAGTLVNTGHQVFSGTVLGSGPVLLHDDEFRFEVDLATGATLGHVFLENRIAGDRIRCELVIEGTGMSPDGNATVGYTGQCRVRSEPREDLLTVRADSWTTTRG